VQSHRLVDYAVGGDAQLAGDAMRFWLIAAFLLAVVSGASAQGIQPGPGLPVSGGGGGGYQGPCDVITCTANVDAYFAVEMCVANAYSGNTADIVDSATGNTTGTRLQCSSGTVSALVSGSACTFVTGNACSSLATTCASGCTIKVLYNQLGSSASTLHDLDSPSTLSSRMTVTTSALNSRACLTGDGTNRYLQQNGVFGSATYAQPFTTAAVAKRSGNFTSTQSMINDGNTYNMGFRPSTNLVGSLSGTVTATATDNVFNSIMEVANGSSSFMVVNGSAGSTGTVTGVNPNFVGAFAGTSSPMLGNICEIMVITSALNATQYGNLNTNQRASNRWGSSF
jgi:hypothetical protein